MAYICEDELRRIYEDVSARLSGHGYDTEIAMIRDYSLKLTVILEGNPLGKLIIDYSPKREATTYRMDGDLSKDVYQKIMNIISPKPAPVNITGRSFRKDGATANSNTTEPSGVEPSEVSVAGSSEPSSIGSSDPSVGDAPEPSGYQAYVDGSFIEGCIGYGSVILKGGQMVAELYGSVDDPEAYQSRQVGGEIRAVVETLKWCKNRGISEIEIFFDFLNIEKWATGAYKTNTPMTIAYKQFIDGCNVRITWHKVESHTGIPLNDRADELAKKGAQQKAERQRETASKPEDLSGWLIYNGNMNSNKFNEQIEWFQRAALNNGMTLEPVRNDDLAACVIQGKTEIRSPFDKLPRFALFWDKDVRLARQMEKLGVKLFNASRAIAICDDKNMTHQMLSDQGIPMPDTIFAPLVYSGCDCDEAYFVERIESILSYPMIVKEAYGSFGAQVYMAKNRDELLGLRKRLAAKPHLYQEYIRTSHGRDVRIQMVGDRVVAAMLRTSDTDFRANITAGGNMQPFDPPKAFSDLAIRASRLLGLDFAGVDILFGKNDQPILCEINSNAHMKNLFDCTGVDVADLIIKYIRQRVMVL